jgi:hypothetical protein
MEKSGNPGNGKINLKVYPKNSRNRAAAVAMTR